MCPPEEGEARKREGKAPISLSKPAKWVCSDPKLVLLPKVTVELPPCRGRSGTTERFEGCLPITLRRADNGETGRKKRKEGRWTEGSPRARGYSPPLTCCLWKTGSAADKEGVHFVRPGLSSQPPF